MQIEYEFKRGVPVITVGYGPEQMLKIDVAKDLSTRMIETYDELTGQRGIETGSCVVVITAETAGSPLVRALFELYKLVFAKGGQVICVGFPADYIQALITIGMPALEGFSLGSDEEQAVAALVTTGRPQ